MILGFMELTPDQRPDERIYLDDEALAAHFAELEETSKSGSKEPVPDLQQNELTRGMRRG